MDLFLFSQVQAPALLRAAVLAEHIAAAVRADYTVAAALAESIAAAVRVESIAAVVRAESIAAVVRAEHTEIHHKQAVHIPVHTVRHTAHHIARHTAHIRLAADTARHKPAADTAADNLLCTGKNHMMTADCHNPAADIPQETEDDLYCRYTAAYTGLQIRQQNAAVHTQAADTADR